MRHVCIAAGLVALALSTPGCGSSGGPDLVLRDVGVSMEPTYAAGTNLAIDVHAFDHAKPKIGEIVVFHPPAGADTLDAVCGDRHQGFGHSQACDQPTPDESSVTFVKRVVGVPGDRISIVNGDVILDGKAEHSAPTRACGHNPRICAFPETIVIPQGHYFVIGDNRPESDDSRFWGPIPESAIIGKVTGTTTAKASGKAGL